jgi:hypothetical protein
MVNTLLVCRAEEGSTVVDSDDSDVQIFMLQLKHLWGWTQHEGGTRLD